MVRRAAVLAALAALFPAVPAGATPPGPLPPLVAKAPVAPLVHARPGDDAAAIRRGLTRAVAGGRLSGAESREYRAIVTRAVGVLGNVSGSRRTVLARVLNLVRRQAGAFTRPRALALFSMLDENTRYLARRGLPPNETDVVGRGGVVYRVGWGYGLQFHPLGNVAALNAHLYANRTRQARALASALAARAVPNARGGAVWEYYFPYGGGSPPWTSGMAQALGAQAFARSGERLNAPDLFAVARRAYAAIPGRLVRSVSTGPWVRLYSFNGMVVLNAQLQSFLSIRDYSRIVNDGGAEAFASRLETSSRGLLPRFDTGYWSNYTPGSEAPVKYHRYHVELLHFMAARTGLDLWAKARDRFARYTREPPVFKLGNATPAFYPWPKDGFRDQTRLTFWLSKISSVAVTVGGRRYGLGTRRHGWHTFAWGPGRTAARTYQPTVSAVDLAGNRGGAKLRPITVAVDRTAPAVTASVQGRRLAWRASDPTTPWLRMWVVVTRGDERRRLELGRRRLSGSLILAVPRGTWQGVLFVADTSGNRTRVPLGPVPAHR